MSPRSRLALIAGVIALSGCGDFVSSPPSYVPAPSLSRDLGEKPQIRARVVALTEAMFGPNPAALRVPPEAPIRAGGAFLASRAIIGEDSFEAPSQKVYLGAVDEDSGELSKARARGGYAIYREQCMHCHGASGDGNGPTAPWLWPSPRDYRPGIFKFTSTAGSGSASKPTRDDLRRTLHHGIEGTSMPAFQALLNDEEIEQVIDYVMFLSIRGETERNLVYLSMDFEDADAETEVNDDLASQAAQQVYDSWASADENVIDPSIPRVEPTRQSILRGRDLYLGGGATKLLQCYGCHGLDARGNGESFIDYDTFYAFTFARAPAPENLVDLREISDAAAKKCCSDEWGTALRPANLSDPNPKYKGGRRPIDLYWRIAKGINGTPMPAHLGTLTEAEIWDVVNFVLALPYEPGLLEDAKPNIGPAPEATPALSKAGRAIEDSATGAGG